MTTQKSWLRLSLVIAKRELKSMFVSPIAYVAISGFAVLSGWIFFNLLARFQQVSSVYTQFAAQRPELLDQLNLQEMVLQPTFLNVTIILILLFPLMSMRLIAEERRQKTDELLFTSPITSGAVVFGKFLALMTVYLLMLVVTTVYPAVLIAYGEPGPSVLEVSAAYMGLMLLGMGFAGVGLFTSSITTNQIVAAVSCFVVLLLFYVIDWIAGSAGGLVKEVLEYISLIRRYQDFVKGIVDLKSVVFYLSFMAMSLFCAKAALDSLRIRS